MKHHVMLAGKVDLPSLTYPCFVSPKLDGIRAWVAPSRRIISRSGILLPNRMLQKAFKSEWMRGLDGEIIIGSPTAPNVFRNTDSVVMSIDKPITGALFHVFDYTKLGSRPYSERLKALIDLFVEHAEGAPVTLVQQFVVNNEEELLRMEANFVADGYEGAMVRSMDGLYKFGRSTTREGYLLKLKRFEDSEAVVIGWEEQQHNENAKNERGKRTSHKAGKVGAGILGALTVVDSKSGVEFSVGSGFTAAERTELWAIRETLHNRVVKYKYFPTGSKELPRFPTFIGWRNPIDMTRSKK